MNVRGEVIGILTALPGTDTATVVSPEIRVSYYTPTAQSQERKGSAGKNKSADKLFGAAGTLSYHVYLNNNSLQKGIAGERSGDSLQRGMDSGLISQENASVASAGFAVPINDLKPLIAQLKTGKPVQEVWLGLQTSEIKRDPPSGLGMVASLHSVQVDGVYQGSPAAHADIQSGDELWDLNDKSIGSPADLRRFMLSVQVGDKVDVIVGRDGKPVRFTLTVAPRPQSIPRLIFTQKVNAIFQQVTPQPKP